LLDTNVLLDVLLQREPYVETSGPVWEAVERGQAKGFMAAHAVTTIHYVLHKHAGAARTSRVIRELLQVFRVATVNHAVVQKAADLDAGDFEDAVTAFAASAAECDYIVTRDPAGFRGAAVRGIAPRTVLPLLTR
jgi:predicted nucleic acid-binding protein